MIAGKRNLLYNRSIGIKGCLKAKIREAEYEKMDASIVTLFSRVFGNWFLGDGAGGGRGKSRLDNDGFVLRAG